MCFTHVNIIMLYTPEFLKIYYGIRSRDTIKTNRKETIGFNASVKLDTECWVENMLKYYLFCRYLYKCFYGVCFTHLYVYNTVRLFLANPVHIFLLI